MTDHPTYDDDARFKYQIQCIIKNEFDSLLMSKEDREKSSERAADIIIKLLRGKTV